MEGFKFKMGNIVAVIGTCTSTERGFFDNDQRFLVTALRADECYAGRQNFYVCRGIQPNGSVTKDYMMFVENELEPSEPFKPREQKSK